MSSLYRRNGIYWLGYKEHGKRKDRSLKTRDKTTAVFRKAQIDQLTIQGGSVIPNSSNFCAPALEEYKEFKANRRNAEYNNSVYKSIKEFLDWGDITQFRQINDHLFESYLGKKRLKGNSTATLNHIIRRLKEWLRYAQKRGLIADNPLQEFKKFTQEKNPPRFLSKEEIHSLLEASQDPTVYADGHTTLYPVIMTGVYTGMRQAELFSLTWQDIDFERNRIFVVNKENFQTKSLKFRVIPLHPALKEVLIKEKTPGSTGKCFDVTNWKRLFKRIVVDRAKLLNVGFHTLRHTFASHLIMAGSDLPTVSELLGHSEIKTTMIYSHLLQEHKEKMILKLDI